MSKKKIKGNVATANKKLASYAESPKSPYAPTPRRIPIKTKKK
jgi:hypothetical protein